MVRNEFTYLQLHQRERQELHQLAADDHLAAQAEAAAPARAPHRVPPPWWFGPGLLGMIYRPAGLLGHGWPRRDRPASNPAPIPADPPRERLAPTPTLAPTPPFAPAARSES